MLPTVLDIPTAVPQRYLYQVRVPYCLLFFTVHRVYEVVSVGVYWFKSRHVCVVLCSNLDGGKRVV